MDAMSQSEALTRVESAPRSNDRSSSMPTGYNNTFPTRSTVVDPTAPPPRYTPTETESSPRLDVLPAYTCTLAHGGVVSILTEMSTPFVENSEQVWHDCYAVLTGTCLNIYKLKSVGLFSVKERAPNMSRLIQSCTLQHAEVGLALDFRQDGPIPRSTIAKLTPPSMRRKLYETDPALFEPVRQWCVRLRVESEQLLLCLGSEDEMLEWVEKLAMGIDLAPALDQRSEPAYRSVPRRNRRQRRLEALAFRGQRREQGEEQDPAQRLIEQQQRLFRRLYPHLLSEVSDARPEPASPTGLDHTDEREDENTTADLRDPEEQDAAHTTSRQDSGLELTQTITMERVSSQASTRIEYDPKTAIRPERSAASLTRFRRRCAPVLLLQAPRCSDIIMHKGRRMRLDMQDLSLRPFELNPPRYSDHTFPEHLTSTYDLSLRRPSITRNISELSQASTSSSTSIEATLEDVIEDSLAITPARLSQLSTVSTIDSTTRTVKKTKSLSTLSSGDLSLRQGGLRSFREKLLRRRKSGRFEGGQGDGLRSGVALVPVFA